MVAAKLAGMFPKSITVPMLNGKCAKIPPISLETLCVIDETRGGLEQLVLKVFKNPISNIPLISEVVFDMLDNKDDFEDLRDFRRHFDIKSLMALVDGVTQLFNASMPSSGASKELVEGAKKKFRGQK